MQMKFRFRTVVNVYMCILIKCSAPAIANFLNNPVTCESNRTSSDQRRIYIHNSNIYITESERGNMETWTRRGKVKAAHCPWSIKMAAARWRCLGRQLQRPAAHWSTYRSTVPTESCRTPTLPAQSEALICPVSYRPWRTGNCKLKKLSLITERRCY